MLDHARTVGGPALRELTFHQRAGLLKALGLRLMADKDEFYAPSHRTGATDRDSAVDVDGGFGTVLSYASKAKRELPDDTVVLDGAVEPLGKRGRSPPAPSGRRCAGSPCRSTRSTSRCGASSRSWPLRSWPRPRRSSSRPARPPTSPRPSSGRSSSSPAARGVGAAFAGSAPMCWTPSAGRTRLFTACGHRRRKLRSTLAVVANSVRFSAEADSLNCAVLGPDATPTPLSSGCSSTSWSPR